jgi:hypothetical protein
MFHFQESKMQATRLVVEYHRLADCLSKQSSKHTTAPRRTIYIQKEKASVIDRIA